MGGADAAPAPRPELWLFVGLFAVLELLLGFMGRVGLGAADYRWLLAAFLPTPLSYSDGRCSELFMWRLMSPW